MNSLESMWVDIGIGIGHDGEVTGTLRVSLFKGLLLVVVAGVLLGAHAAEVEQSIRYEYDAAGNLVGVRSIGTTGAPEVQNVSPLIINEDRVEVIEVDGDNLFEATITTDVVASISDIDSTSGNFLTFHLLVGNTAEQEVVVTLTNRFGSDAFTLRKTEPLPILSVNPIPLILETGAESLVSIRLNQPFDQNLLLQLSFADPGVAEFADTVGQIISAELPVGQTEFSFIVRGVGLGTVPLRITSEEFALAANISVSVIEEAELPAGEQYLLSKPLGIRFQRLGAGTSLIHSASIGIRRGRPAVEAGEKVYSPIVGIIKET